MLRKIVPFKRWHYDWLDLAAEPGTVRSSNAMVELMERENSGTGIVDGEVVFCAGTLQQWPMRHTAWALLRAGASRAHMLWITREVRANLAKVKGRIEFTVRADFPAGQKWARLLGFRVETPLLEAYGPEGEDHIGYVRIN